MYRPESNVLEWIEPYCYQLFPSFNVFSVYNCHYSNLQQLMTEWAFTDLDMQDSRDAYRMQVIS